VIDKGEGTRFVKGTGRFWTVLWNFGGSQQRDQRYPPVAEVTIASELVPLEGADLGHDLLTAYLEWLPPDDCFDQLLGPNVM